MVGVFTQYSLYFKYSSSSSSEQRFTSVCPAVTLKLAQLLKDDIL
jgi:hypothetical protein